MSKSPRKARDRSQHEPAGRVRTGLKHASDPAFRTGHIRAGSRAFDVVFRFVAGICLGMVLASIARGGRSAEIVIDRKWPHHPVTDSVALGFLIGVVVAPFALAYFRAREIHARRTGQEQPEFSWVGARLALISFVLTYIALWGIGSTGIDLRS